MSTPKSRNHFDLSYPLIELKSFLPNDFNVVNEYYEIMLEILYKKIPKPATFTDAEKAQIAAAAAKVKNTLGQPVLKKLFNLFKPDTILEWYRKLKREKATYNTTPKKPGRPPISLATENMVLELFAENPNKSSRWISLELKKLGHTICHNTVNRILDKNGLCKEHKGMSWATFIKAHMDVTWACDFFTEEVLTKAGLITTYTLFFIHHATRQVYLAGCTYSPDFKWVTQQARNFSMFLDENPHLKCRYLIHDNDTLLKPLKGILSYDNIKIVKTSYQAPRQNAYAERFVREVRETLDNMIILGWRHLNHIMKKIVLHHNKYRMHQSLNNTPNGYLFPEKPASSKHVKCKRFLGGLLKHYYVAYKFA